MNRNKQIKVSKDVGPIHFRLRKEPELVVNADYYFSYGANKATPCVLLEVIEAPIKQVRIGIKNNSKEGYGAVETIYSDEIGRTPEETVINTRTS